MRSSSPTSTSPLSLIPYSSSSSSSFTTANPNRNRLKLPYRSFSLLVVSSFPRRHHRPNRHRIRRSPFPPPVSPSSSDDNPNRISLSLSLDSLSDRLSSGLRRFIAAGADAFDDLSTSVQIEPGHHVTFSCRRSSLLFLTNLLALGFIVFVAARFSAGLGFWRGLGFGERREVVRRRDRSLGGREVVVGTASPRRIEECIPARGNPVPSNVGRRGKGMVKKEELPEWWPLSVSSSSSLSSDGAFGNEELKREADRLLRQICKISGARVTFGTANARDSFYRASVDFVLNICSRVVQPDANVQINGEEARQFISQLADNIGLEANRAATIIRAAVAARARSCFLQSWSFEVQGKRFEALAELSKICHIFQSFPPEEYSPEMEMVASGLKKTIGAEQRRHLLALVREVCVSTCHRIAEEALGLIDPNGYEDIVDGLLSEKFQL